MIYVLGLQMGGLMEDPEWHIEHLTTVEADSLNKAKQKWAEETGHVDENWNEATKTYQGFQVIEC